MKFYDITVRIKARNADEAEALVTSDFYWDGYYDEPTGVEFEILGIVEKVGQ